MPFADWSPSRRQARLASIGLIVAFPIVAFHSALWGPRSLTFSDALEYELPIYRVVYQAWRHGHIPTWNRYAFSGYPLLGSSQGGVFYFPHVLYGLMDPRRAFAWLAVAHMAVAGLGARALAKRLWHGEFAGLIAGLAYTLSSFAIGRLAQPVTWAGYAFLPWALWAVDHVIEHRQAIWFVATAASLAMVAFDGHPQLYWIASTATVFYATVRALANGESTWRERGHDAVAAFGAVALGGALAAMQLLPSAAYAPISGRPRLTLAQAMTYAYPGTHLPLLGFPYLFGATDRVVPYTDEYKGSWAARELIGYVGLGALVLAVAGITLAWRRSSGRALMAVIVFELFVMLGSATPIGPWLFHYGLFFNRFRAWGRHVVVVDLAVAVLAGAGAQVVVHSTARIKTQALWRGLGAFGALCATGWFVQRWQALRPFRAGPAVRTLAVVVPLAFAAAAVVALAVSLLDRRLAALLLVAVVIGDSWAFASSFEWRAYAPPYASLASRFDNSPPIWGLPRDFVGGIDRFATDAPLLQMTWVGKGILGANGYDPIFPAPYATAVGDMVEYGGLLRADLWTTSPVIVDLLRIGTFVAQAGTTSPAPPPTSDWTNIGPIVGTPLTRYERQPHLPEAFLVGSSRRVVYAEALNAIRTDRTLDPSTGVQYEGQCGQCPPASAVAATAGPPPTVVWGERTARATVQADKAAILVVSQAWSKGWKASVDGHAVPVVRIFGLTMGAPVPAGRHEVRFFYDAPGLRSGLLLSGLTALALLAAVWFSEQRRRDGHTRRHGHRRMLRPARRSPAHARPRRIKQGRELKPGGTTDSDDLDLETARLGAHEVGGDVTEGDGNAAVMGVAPGSDPADDPAVVPDGLVADDVGGIVSAARIDGEGDEATGRADG